LIHLFDSLTFKEYSKNMNMTQGFKILELLLDLTPTTLSIIVGLSLVSALTSAFFVAGSLMVYKSMNPVTAQSFLVFALSCLVLTVSRVSVTENTFTAKLGEYNPRVNQISVNFKSSQVSIFSNGLCENTDELKLFQLGNGVSKEIHSKMDKPCEKYVATIRCVNQSFKDCVSNIKEKLEKIKEQSDGNGITPETNEVDEYPIF
jgi:hypothetical protein